MLYMQDQSFMSGFVFILNSIIMAEIFDRNFLEATMITNLVDGVRG